MILRRSILILALVYIGLIQFVAAQDTALLPEVVKPGRHGNPPADAVVLIGRDATGSFLSAEDNSPVKWKVRKGSFTVEPGTGNIQTVEHYGDMQLHVEFRIPRDARKKEGQKSGNSGIYLMGKYEVQVLNSFENETYTDGQAGAVYKQYIPLVNACLKPGKWQAYDIVFEAPQYDENGLQVKPPFITVFHNGILIQNHVEVKGPTMAYNEKLPEHAEKGPLLLQDHDNKVSYRNIWIREL